ncbi:hypothetical protein ACFLZV_02210, partial [Candidatus Margulisiibacteriota bacterium]
MRKIILSIIAVFLLFCSIAIANVPMRISFQAKLADNNGLIRNEYRDIKIGVYDQEDKNSARWTEIHRGVWFNEQGICNIIIGSQGPLTIEKWMDPNSGIMYIEKPFIGITIGTATTAGTNLVRGSETGPAFVPFPSAPYAIQAKIAEEVLSVDASKIIGTFTQKVVMDNDLIVSKDALVVDSKNKKVGIGTSQPQYSLDVKGYINADGYMIKGEDIASKLTWERNANSLYYLKGYVGIGTTAPSYNLDIVGTINATNFLKNGDPLTYDLEKEIVWKKGSSFSVDNTTYETIYLKPNTPKERLVGIGTSVPSEKLEVDGAIRIGAYKGIRGASPREGTIQFYQDDFLGYTNRGWQSLTSLSGRGDPGEIAYWDDDAVITGSASLYWDQTNNNLGIGTSSPNAKLEIKAAQNADLIRVKSADDNEVFYVGYNADSGTYNVGIGTANPTQKLVVNGIIDASDYTINGVPILEAIPEGSYWPWIPENTARIFFDEGFVGIGTTEPRNLLELASRHPSASPAITFDIFGEDLFSIGINSEKPDEFIISKGGNLNSPVFTFKGHNIGIGLETPKTNLHVSGNLGVVIEGRYLGDSQMTEEDKLTVTGAGSRLVWYPAKAAFRAGYVSHDHWDHQNLGDFSGALGYNSKASGKYAFVAGGLNNSASGEGAVVLGGMFNIASGKYSIAGGHKAQASKLNSFVWADYTPDPEYFTSLYENQFIIRANNGVGIGTTDTKGSMLTLVRKTYGEYLLRILDNTEKEALVVTTSGNVGIGTSDPGKARLAVMGGRIGIGTTVPTATLTVVNQNDNELIFVVKQGQGVTVGMLINTKGQVGIGVTEGYIIPDDVGLAVNGIIKSSQFRVVDPDDPDGEIILQPNPGSPWADPSKNDNNTHRSQGMVGIGTPSPNSLLELSNRNTKGSLPVITFDIDGNDIYSLGPTLNADSNDYLFTIQTGSSLSPTPAIAIASASVGIGTNLASPKATLDVSGNAIFNGQVLVATTNVSDNIYSLYVDGSINVNKLYIGGSVFTPQDSPWKTAGLNIYYTSGNVGIGTSTPTELLEVSGTILTDKLVMTSTLQLADNAYLTTEILKLRDPDPQVTSPGILYVDDNSLLWQGPNDVSTKKLSSPLQRGIGSEGNLAFWVDQSSIGESSVYWKEEEHQLTVSGNLVVSRNFTTPSGFIITSNIAMGVPSALSLEANLSYVANPYSVRSFTGENINISINKNWGHPVEKVQIKGMEISMESKESGYLFSNSEAIGLYIDVSKVNIDTGHKYAAIFKGGNVGIGEENPQAELEVAGTVSANYFNLSGGLTVPQLIVNDGDFIAIAADSTSTGGGYLGRVAINFPFPGNWQSLSKEERQIALAQQLAQTDAELYVNGTISANMLKIAAGLLTTTINIQNGAFVVDATGNIGIGTLTPNSQIEISKVITGQNDIEENFYSQKIFVNVDGAGEPNSGLSFSLDKNITGLDISIKSEDNNTIQGNVEGLKIDLSDINLQSNSSATGLFVNVEDTKNSSGTRYAAIFTGGYVGIGTNTPNAELEVSGNILAKNLTLDGTLSAEQAEFNFLTINESASLNGVVTINNNLIVLGTATINHLVLNDTLESAKGNFSTINANIASINELLKTAELWTATLDAEIGYFDKLGIGREVTSDYVLAVSGNIATNKFIIEDTLELISDTLDVNNGKIYVSPTNTNIGIGTKLPKSILHIYEASPVQTAFLARDNDTWNAIHIQSQGSFEKLAAGIILIPDSASPSPDIGSGIIAVRSSDLTDRPGSHLVFVTDPANGVPAERMRISHEGNIGIGTTTPRAQLEVNGSTLFDGSVTINGNLITSEITGSDGITINPNGALVINAFTRLNSQTKVEKGLYLKKENSVTSTSDYGIIYSGSAGDNDHSLYYLRPNTQIPVNISAPFIGKPTRIAFFNTGGGIDDSANLFWDNNTFKIGTNNVTTSFEVITTLNNSINGNIALQKILMGFADRGALGPASSGEFTGLDIAFISDKVDSSIEFGRLADGETAVGLKVDLRELRAKYYQDSTPLKGTKYAALFLGGGVGIGTSRPEAALHISSEEYGNTPLIIDSKNISGTHKNALTVSSNSYIGIGTPDPQSRVSIKSETAAESPFSIIDSTGTNPIFYVASNNYIGLGTYSPQAQLDVQGSISANAGYFSSIEATTLNVGDGAFFINASGNIGIGTTDPSGNIAFRKEISNSTTVPADEFISHKVDVILTGGQESNPFRFQRNITGLDINIESASSTRLGNTNSSYNATGIRVNMTDLLLDQQNNASAIGLYIDVANNNAVPETGGTRYAGIFNGGYVGIGTATPSVELEVSGNIKA